MSERLSSVRLRRSLHQQLRLMAAALSRKRQVRITMRSLLEEGVQGLFAVPIPVWVQWASESALAPEDERNPIDSESFRIDADLVGNLGVLAAEVSMRSPVPITKAHLLEEAGRRIIEQVQAAEGELDATLQPSETPQ
jgi:hypothetical protein